MPARSRRFAGCKRRARASVSRAMKDKFPSYCAEADEADARRDASRDDVRAGSRDSAGDARNTRAERIASDVHDAPRGVLGDDSRDSARDRSRDSARDTASAAAARDAAYEGSHDDDGRRGSARDVARDSVRDAAHDSARDNALDARIAAERRLLAALCQGSIVGAARGEVLRRLREHAFGDAEHEIIFRALAKIPSGDAEFVRTALGLRLTRAGFPEFDLETFFAAPAPAAAEVAEILRAFDSL